MAYVSLYRRWRPQTFGDIVGQEYVTRTLVNSLKSGNFVHAYLFAGPRGTGKTTTARVLAKALNCENGPGPEPCNSCASCQEITEGTSLDVVEIDAASNRGIDDIRELRERVMFKPTRGRVKVYILDEAHMLTTEAANAFLKMLEEPPEHVVFVMATTEPHRMPPTILSRCQRYDFRSVPAPVLAEYMAGICEREGVEAEEGALRLIARRARGSVRDGLVLLEQAILYGEGKVLEREVAGLLGVARADYAHRLGGCLAEGKAGEAIALVEELYEGGVDLLQAARELQEHLRRLLLLAYADLRAEELEVDPESLEEMKGQAARLGPARLVHGIKALQDAVREMPHSSQPRILLESTLVEIMQPELSNLPSSLLSRVEALERKLDEWINRGRSGALPLERITPTREEGGREAATVPARAAAEPETDQDPAATTVEEPHPGSVTKERPSGGAVAGEAVDIHEVRRAWHRIREKVKEKRVVTHAFLLEGKPMAVEGGELVLAFPHDRSFHQGEMQKDVNRAVLEEALEEVLGARLAVRTVLEDGPVAGATGSPERRERTKEAAARTGAPRQEGGPVPEEVERSSGDEDAAELIREVLGGRLVGELEESAFEEGGGET
ncbi:MAG: DNA polymerase III subunit gamma/tau [Candidatus Geothermincolales bacterium]